MPLQVRERDRVAVLVGEGEVGRLIAGVEHAVTVKHVGSFGPAAPAFHELLQVRQRVLSPGGRAGGRGPEEGVAPDPRRDAA